MKLPNGFGSVYKLSGRRRRPWVAAKTFGWEFDEKGQKVKQKQQAIGYYATRQEAMTALVQYNENPYDLNFNKTTFSEVYEKWSEEYFPTLSNASSIRTITAAYKYCTDTWNNYLSAAGKIRRWQPGLLFGSADSAVKQSVFADVVALIPLCLECFCR